MLLPIQVSFSLAFRIVVCLNIFNVPLYADNLELFKSISLVTRTLYLCGQAYFCLMWYALVGYFIKRRSGTAKGRPVVILMYALSTCLIADHYSLVIMGIVELYAPTQTFYNVFCTVLYVVDPVLIFLTTIALLYMFYTLANKKREQFRRS